MTEKEYLKIICELAMVAGEAVGILSGFSVNDNCTEIHRHADLMIDILNLRIDVALDKLNEKPNQ